jgi:molybdopterin-containing oxidoreductase family membrane subunit
MTSHELTPVSHQCPALKFRLWMIPWFLVLVVGIYASLQVLIGGLSHTNMDNRYAFGLWIFLDLTVIAFGAGAFMSGILTYVLRWKDMKSVINLAVLMGFLCYSGAVAILMVDVGQPLRAWFTFWHPNVHSMLAEVTFCLTIYLTVLLVEVIPILLRHRKLRGREKIATVGAELHRGMIVLAILGATLSFFHQGSLGGLYGVLEARPFAHRDAFYIWPTTFFLFIASAVAVGPSFLVVIARTAQWITRRPLVPTALLDRLARLSGTMLVVYLLLKGVDTLVWLNRTVPEAQVHPASFYRIPLFGSWTLVMEFLVLGIVPGLWLRRRPTGQGRTWQTVAAVAACGGIALNRGVATLQTLTLPTLPFEAHWIYVPSWQEVAAFAGVIAYAVIALSLAYRWLPLFPSARSLDLHEGR